MRQSKVTYQDWMEMHPWLKATDDSVVYYVKLANAILSELQKEELSIKVAVQAACGFAAYLEDVISGRHIFGTLQNINKKKYGFRLPFFPILEDEYYEDEVNFADVTFLYWHFLAQSDAGLFPSPKLSTDQIERVAKVFDLLESAFEDAPESEDLGAFLTLVGVDKPTFNDIAPRLVYIQRQSYINHITAEREIDIYTDELKAEAGIDEASFFFFLNEYANQMLFNLPMSASAEFTSSFYAELVGSKHKAYKLIKSIGRDKLSTLFTFVEEKKDCVVLKHSNSDAMIEVLKESLPAKISDKSNWLCEVVAIGDKYYCVSDVVHPEESPEDEEGAPSDLLANIFESRESKVELLARVKQEFDKLYDGKPFVFTGSYKKANEIVSKIFAQVAPGRLMVEALEEQYEGNCVLYLNPINGFELYNTFNLFGKKIIRGEKANLKYPTLVELLTSNSYPKEFVSEIIKQGWITWDISSEDTELLRTYTSYLLDYYKVEPVLV
ncbi:MAG: DUF3843 family protein [Bacteroidales bacterium]